MAKFKLNRKRKKEYKKDLVKAFYKHWNEALGKSFDKGDFIAGIGCHLLTSADYKKVMKSEWSYRNNVYDWEWLYFRKRVKVRGMCTIKNSPDTGEIDEETGIWIRFDKPKENYMDDDMLLEWYKKYYPNDKLSHHFCKQNRNKWH